MDFKNSDRPNPFDCYYLQLHDGESRIILPLESENIVRPIQNIPHLFVHFPLIGSEYFNVSFIFIRINLLLRRLETILLFLKIMML